MSKFNHGCLFLFALILTVCVASERSLHAQDAEKMSIEDMLSDPVLMTWLADPRFETCVGCHLGGISPAQLLAGDRAQLTEFSRQKEMLYWLQKDKHTIARVRVEPLTDAQSGKVLLALGTWLTTRRDAKVIDLEKNGSTIDQSQLGFDEASVNQWFGTSNQLSRRICDKYFGDGVVETDDGYTRFRNECLTCHGGYQDDAGGFSPFVSGDPKLANFDPNESTPEFANSIVNGKQIGIDCFYCHQSGPNLSWRTEHTVPAKWRLKPPVEKQALGMNDLANTANQSKLCFDCHVGNRQKNMFVSHDMYAAGHPPLPSIEVQTFCDQMPQHWRSPGELYQSLTDEADRDPFFTINYPGLNDPGKVFWDTRKMLIGALEAQRHQLDLLIQSANVDDWADYALYDCAACHHELQRPSVRQARHGQAGYGGAPGRPRHNEWPVPLLRVAYQIGPKNQPVQAAALAQKLQRCFDRTPFGKADEVHQVATELRRQIKTLTAAAQKRQIDSKTARNILAFLAAKTPDAAMVTYDSARQTAWAMNVIADELKFKGASLDSTLHADIRSLGDPTVTGVQTDLPTGRSDFIFPNSLQRDLDHRANYQPQRFIDQLRLCRPAAGI